MDKAIHIAPGYLENRIDGDEESRREITERSLKATSEIEGFNYIFGEGSSEDLNSDMSDMPPESLVKLDSEPQKSFLF